MSSTSPSYVPWARVILDILDRTGGATRYRLERLLPLHPDFIDFSVSIGCVLRELFELGAIQTEEGKLSLTDVGTTEVAELRDSRWDTNYALAYIELDFSKREPRAQDRFAARASIGGTEVPVGMKFLTEWSRGSSHVRVDVISPDADRSLLQKGAKFDILEDSQIVGWGRFTRSAVAALSPTSELQVFDRPAFTHRSVRAPRPRRAA